MGRAGSRAPLSLGGKDGPRAQRAVGAGSCPWSRAFMRALSPFIQSELLHRESHCDGCSLFLFSQPAAPVRPSSDSGLGAGSARAVAAAAELRSVP